jgi:hypothetical protein
MTDALKRRISDDKAILITKSIADFEAVERYYL